MNSDRFRVVNDGKWNRKAGGYFGSPGRRGLPVRAAASSTRRDLPLAGGPTTMVIMFRSPAATPAQGPRGGGLGSFVRSVSVFETVGGVRKRVWEFKGERYEENGFQVLT